MCSFARVESKSIVVVESAGPIACAVPVTLALFVFAVIHDVHGRSQDLLE